MYKARDVIIDNALPIAVGSSWAAIFSLYGTLLMVNLSAAIPASSCPFSDCAAGPNPFDV